MNDITLPMDDEQVMEFVGQYVGKTFNASYIETIEEHTGRPTRASGKGYIGTRDFRPERVNVDVNDQGLVIGASFG